MRKRASIFLTVFLIALFSIAYVHTPEYKIIPTMAVPVTNKKIIIDAGHGTPDEGAQNEEGVSEAKVNLSIALKLKKILEESNATVILTRKDDNAIYDENAKTIAQKKVSDIKNRVKIANESNADIFVSIHLNKIQQEQCTGWQTFYNENNPRSKILAKAIQENIGKTVGISNKRKAQKLTNVYIMKHVEIPITIVECGFLSNKEESKKLQTDEYQEKLAWGIYDGITEYFQK